MNSNSYIATARDPINKEMSSLKNLIKESSIKKLMHINREN